MQEELEQPKPVIEEIKDDDVPTLTGEVEELTEEDVKQKTKRVSRKEKRHLLDRLIKDHMIKDLVNTLYESAKGVQVMSRDKNGTEKIYTTKPSESAAMWLLEAKFGKAKQRTEIGAAEGQKMQLLVYLPDKDAPEDNKQLKG